MGLSGAGWEAGVGGRATGAMSPRGMTCPFLLWTGVTDIRYPCTQSGTAGCVILGQFLSLSGPQPDSGFQRCFPISQVSVGSDIPTQALMGFQQLLATRV